MMNGLFSPSALRPAFRVALGLLAALFVIAEVRFCLAKPDCETVYPLAISPPHGPSTNLAFFRHGPTVRVSSINFFDRHHSGYLVDETNFSPDQKWMSDTKDRKPWVEIRFRGSHYLAGVRIAHGGFLEQARYTARAYTITCLINDRLSDKQLVIENNSDSRPLHALPCENASGIRIDFRLRGDDAVRLYEVEALGIW